MQENNDHNLDEGFEAPEDAYTKQQAPAVANTPGKNYVIMAVFAVAVIIMGFMLFGGSKKSDEDQVNSAVEISKQPTITPPPIIIPPEPPEPPQPPVAPIDENAPKELTQEEIQINKEQAQKQKQRMQSEMLVSRGGLFGGPLGGGAAAPGGPTTLTQVNDNDPNIGFADSFYNQEDSPFTQARKLGDTSRLITQGKMIDAVLETPINTDVPGMIRAVVSRDVYAESGKMILIPKGSRLVGTYNSFTIRGNKRVNVIWSRVIRPDGIDLMLRSPGASQLGVAGLEGEVDNKYMEIFSSAFLVSAINIAMAAGVDAIDPQTKKQTTNTDGSTTTETNAKQEAALKSLDMFASAGSNLIQDFLNLKPTITVNQGARVNVFVNRDLVFPAGLTSSVKMIQ